MEGSDSPPRYAPRPLREPVTPGISALVEAARQGRLLLYLGAGISIPPPSDGPRGNEVADRLRPVVAELLGVDPAEITETTLEQLSSRVATQASDRLDDLRFRAAEAWDFVEMLSNYGHEVVALLLREGLATVVSANWDCGVENGGQELKIRIEHVATPRDRLRLAPNELPIYKVHGCAKRPRTLVLTREEVDAPARWAKGEVQTALAGGTVVFVGLGTLGNYVTESVQELKDLWIDEGVTVRVVDPNGPSEAWSQVLGDKVADVAITMGAEPFLDDLARAAVIAALSQLLKDARDLHVAEQKDWSQMTLDGCEALRAAFADSPADAILRWWRDGVTSTRNGRLFILEPPGRASALCVAQLGGGDPIDVAGADGDLTVRASCGYLEIASRPGAQRADIERRATDRIVRRRKRGVYASGVPVIAVVHGAYGTFPPLDAKPNIAAADPDRSDIAASNEDHIYVVRAEDATNGRLAA